MTIKELYNYCVHELYKNGEAEFETACIFEDLLGINKHKLFTTIDDASNEQINVVTNAITRRKNGEPLQYILGNWDFYDMRFLVGEGVLIPRPETEMLVDFTLDKLKNIENPVIYDLCAGSGCIGLTLAKHRKDANVFLIEKENEALKYLHNNKTKYGLNNAHIIQGDIFNFNLSKLPNANIILSNPPYIPTYEIEGLQKEVHYEPISALDGGRDGLDFYRCLADKWITKVNKNGYIAMECGDGQSDEIIRLFNEKITTKEVIYDFNNIDRIVAFGI